MVGDLVGVVRGLDKPGDVRVLIGVVREGLLRLRELDAGFGVLEVVRGLSLEEVPGWLVPHLRLVEGQ